MQLVCICKSDYKWHTTTHVRGLHMTEMRRALMKNEQSKLKKEKNEKPFHQVTCSSNWTECRTHKLQKSQCCHSSSYQNSKHFLLGTGQVVMRGEAKIPAAYCRKTNYAKMSTQNPLMYILYNIQIVVFYNPDKYRILQSKSIWETFSIPITSRVS